MASEIEALPGTGRLEIAIKVTADVNVSAYAARQKVNSFLLSEISYLMHAGKPTLLVDELICWQVPVILSLASQGDVGEVGAIEVNVETGQMNISPALIKELNANASDLTRRSAPPADR